MNTEKPSEAIIRTEAIIRAMVQQNCLLGGIFQILALWAATECPALGKNIIDLAHEVHNAIEPIRDE